MDRCLTVVARDRLDLLATFTSRRGDAGEVEVRLDQRYAPHRCMGEIRGDRRAQGHLTTGLREHGFLAIPRW